LTASNRRNNDEVINMNRIAEKFVKFFKEEDGPTAVEYAVMLALIVVVCLGTIGSIGTAANGKFDAVATAIN
jgi:pilus assembly protein Flp/PilA